MRVPYIRLCPEKEGSLRLTKAIHANEDDSPVCDVLQRQKSLFVELCVTTQTKIQM